MIDELSEFFSVLVVGSGFIILQPFPTSYNKPQYYVQQVRKPQKAFSSYLTKFVLITMCDIDRYVTYNTQPLKVSCSACTNSPLHLSVASIWRHRDQPQPYPNYKYPCGATQKLLELINMAFSGHVPSLVSHQLSALAFPPHSGALVL